MGYKEEELKLEEILSKDSTFVVKNGIIKEIKVPPTGYGKQIICWSAGNLTHVEFNYTETIK